MAKRGRPTKKKQEQMVKIVSDPKKLFLLAMARDLRKLYAIKDGELIELDLIEGDYELYSFNSQNPDVEGHEVVDSRRQGITGFTKMEYAIAHELKFQTEWMQERIESINKMISLLRNF